MNKKILVLTLCAVISTSVLIGCGKGSSSSDKSTSEQTQKSAKSKIDLKSVNKVDGVIEYSFKEIKAEKKIRPGVTKDFSIIYESKKEGSKFLDFMMSVKNLKSDKISIKDVIKPTVKIDGKEYDNFFVIEKNDEGFQYANITPIDPLTATTVHILAEVPESELSKDIALNLQIDKKNYEAIFKLESVAPEKKIVKLGETISSEGFAQVKLTNLQFQKRVNPSNPKSFYTYYEVKDTNKIYLVLEVDVKNTKDSKLNADEVLGVNVTYNEKYKYDSFAVIEEAGGGDFNYANITSIDPLTTSKLYYLCEVPQEVKDGKVEIEININGEKYFLNK